MTLHFLVKCLHVLGAIVTLGTGTGIAFVMLPFGAFAKAMAAIVLMLVAL